MNKSLPRVAVLAALPPHAVVFTKADLPAQAHAQIPAAASDAATLPEDDSALLGIDAATLFGMRPCGPLKLTLHGLGSPEMRLDAMRAPDLGRQRLLLGHANGEHVPYRSGIDVPRAAQPAPVAYPVSVDVGSPSEMPPRRRDPAAPAGGGCLGRGA